MIDLNKIDPAAISPIRGMNEESDSFKILEHAISQDSQQYPIVIRKLTEEEKRIDGVAQEAEYGIIDGHHRYKIAQANVQDKILATVLDYAPSDERDIKLEDVKMALRMNSAIPITTLQKGEILYRLIEETGKTDLDIGFRVFKLDSSNMEDTYYLPQEYNLSLIKNKKLYENIKKDRTQEDLLFQVMLQKDFPLSAQIKEEIIDDKRVFSVDGNNLVCCFEDNLTEDLITKIISQKLPRIFVTRNNSVDDNVLTNISPIIQIYSPETEWEVI